MRLILSYTYIYFCNNCIVFKYCKISVQFDKITERNPYDMSYLTETTPWVGVVWCQIFWVMDQVRKVTPQWASLINLTIHEILWQKNCYSNNFIFYIMDQFVGVCWWSVLMIVDSWHRQDCQKENYDEICETCLWVNFELNFSFVVSCSFCSHSEMRLKSKWKTRYFRKGISVKLTWLKHIALLCTLLPFEWVCHVQILCAKSN